MKIRQRFIELLDEKLKGYPDSLRSRLRGELIEEFEEKYLQKIMVKIHN